MFDFYFDHAVALCDKDHRLIEDRAALFEVEPEEILTRLIGVYRAVLADDPAGIPSEQL